MAKIVRFYELGGPDVLKLETFEPAPPEPGEIHVKIEAIGLNRGEASFRSGTYLFQPKLPSTLGGEAAGRVVRVGSDVSDVREGDLVISTGVHQGDVGIYATDVVAPRAGFFKLPHNMDAVRAASSWTAFLTAYGGLTETDKLTKGGFVVISAGASAVGVAALQIARDLGAVPISTTRKPDKVEAIKRAGAAHVIVSSEADVTAEILRITEGKGAPLIFDGVAGPLAEQLFEAVAERGVMLCYGGLSRQPITFARQFAMRKGAAMVGYRMPNTMADKQRAQQAYAYVLERLGDGRLAMPIARTFALDDIVAAHRHLEADQHVGKIMVAP